MKRGLFNHLEQYLTIVKIAAVLDPNFRKTELGMDVDSQAEDEIRRILHVKLSQPPFESESDPGTSTNSLHQKQKGQNYLHLWERSLFLQLKTILAKWKLKKSDYYL